MIAKNTINTHFKVISEYDNRRRPIWSTPIFVSGDKGIRTATKQNRIKKQVCSPKGPPPEERFAIFLM